jgi:hypothetical protein
VDSLSQKIMVTWSFETSGNTHDITSHHRRIRSSVIPLWEPQISHVISSCWKKLYHAFILTDEHKLILFCSYW